MKELKAFPTGLRPLYTNGESVLYWTDKHPDRTVMVDEVRGKIFEMSMDSALSRGGWDEVPNRRRKGSDAK